MIRKWSPFSRPLSTVRSSSLSRGIRDTLTHATRRLAWTEDVPSVFIPTVTDRMLIRTSHPSGSGHCGAIYTDILDFRVRVVDTGNGASPTYLQGQDLGSGQPRGRPPRTTHFVVELTDLLDPAPVVVARQPKMQHPHSTSERECALGSVIGAKQPAFWAPVGNRVRSSRTSSVRKRVSRSCTIAPRALTRRRKVWTLA